MVWLCRVKTKPLITVPAAGGPVSPGLPFKPGRPSDPGGPLKNTLYMWQHKTSNLFIQNTNSNIYIYLLSLTEKAMASQIPWTEEPLRLRSMGSLIVRHD